MGDLPKYLRGGGGLPKYQKADIPQKAGPPPPLEGRPPTPHKADPPKKADPLVNRMTHTCENITFPASLRYAVGNKAVMGICETNKFSVEIKILPVKIFLWALSHLLNYHNYHYLANFVSFVRQALN